jgi:hypothetical protein
MTAGVGFLGGGYLGLSAWMFSQEAAMRAGGGPGIVGFELAGSAGRVEEILAVWGSEGQSAARRSLLIDFGVLSCYGPLMALLCRTSAERLERRGRRRLSRLGAGVAAGQLAAAVAKFSLLGAGLSYLAAGLRPG